MGRYEHYILSGGVELFRYELEGEPLLVTETEGRSFRARGKVWTTRNIRWKGRHRFRWGDLDKVVQESVVHDSGAIGVSATSVEPTEFTREARLAGRERSGRVIREQFGCEVIWPPLEE